MEKQKGKLPPTDADAESSLTASDVERSMSVSKVNGVRRKRLAIALVALVALLAVAVGLGVGLGARNNSNGANASSAIKSDAQNELTNPMPTRALTLDPARATVSSASRDNAVSNDIADDDAVFSTSSATSDGSSNAPCGFRSGVRFATWYGSLNTRAPVLFPQNDMQLANIVTRARDGGCRVRVRGAGHSEDGIVTQKLDQNVVVVHLRDYVPDDAAWNGVLDTTVPSVKISAGASLLELMSVIRPQGYLTRSSTAGRFFAVGGAYLNPSVLGSVFAETRLASHVLAVRVMNADGEINVYDDATSVRAFRGSMGLLGIVTALEIRVRPDAGLQMSRKTLSTEQFNEAAIRSYFTEILANYDGAEWLYYVYEDVVEGLLQKFRTSKDFNHAATQGWYYRELSATPDLAYTGGKAEGLTTIVELTSGLVVISKFLANLIGLTARLEGNRFFDSAAGMPNDGYFVPSTTVPKFELISHTVKCETNCVDEMINLLRATRGFLKNAIDQPDETPNTWFPTLPYEWRIYTVKENEMVLEHLEPGRYVSVENTALYVNNDYEYSAYYTQLEDVWRNLYPDNPVGAIHHGKAYGYGRVPGMGDGDGIEFPFQDETIVDSVYDDAVRDRFVALMERHDPAGVFRAGSVLRMLGLTDEWYTPRQYDGDSCEVFGDAECISNCCDGRFILGGACLAGGKRTGERCDDDCECLSDTSGDPCRWTWLSWKNKCRD